MVSLILKIFAVYLKKLKFLKSGFCLSLGVSSEGSKPPQPSQSQQALDLEMEEGREAEASEPAASSPQGSPHGSPQGSPSPHGSTRGSGTARRSQRGPAFARRGRGNQRPTPIVWNEPGSTSPRCK